MSYPPPFDRSFLPQAVLCSLLLATILRVDAETPAPETDLQITSIELVNNMGFRLSFRSQQGQDYEVQGTDDWGQWVPLGRVPGQTGVSSYLDAAWPLGLRRFYRIVTARPSGPGSESVATLPQPGQLYPAGTRIGGGLLGVEFTIPPNWSGGLRQGTSLMLFGSETEAGAIFGLLGFSGDREAIVNDPALNQGFEMDLGLGVPVLFTPTDAAEPVKENGPNRYSAVYTGRAFSVFGAPEAYYAGLEMILHPDGGGMLFLGLTTEANGPSLQSSLHSFAERVQTTPRSTNTEYVSSLSGRIFQWSGGGDTWSDGRGFYGTSLSSWSNSKAFFCGGGTFEVTTRSESIASSASPVTGFTDFSTSDTTREYGQWTVIESPQHGNLLLVVTLSGFQAIPVRLEPDGSLLVGEHRLQPAGTFQCE